jgi:hypothetical protein
VPIFGMLDPIARPGGAFDFQGGIVKYEPTE